jgi:hypothetical protein
MSINEIRDGMESLLTERMNNVRRVERREGEAGGSNKEFQELFDFARREKEEKQDERKPVNAQAPAPLARSRMLTPEEIEDVKKRKDLAPGQLIDVEA